MILVGIIPGPHEPSLHINSYLEPLVEELVALWKGVTMTTLEGDHVVRAALLCNSSDIPATRKVGGFVGHAALKGCSRCLKEFPTSSIGEKADYSGFNRASWPTRSMEQHKTQGMEWKLAKTLTSRTKIEREFGVRYTELLRLSYFDSARFSVVDPMHNVLLGTAKLVTSLLKEKSILSAANFSTIQSEVDRFIVPPDIGRIPHKIASGFSSFTADQWKNWVQVYSLIVLKDLLSEPQYQCWYTFVKACLILCSRAISIDKVNEMDSLFLRFCQMFEQLFGTYSCTPNLHLHCHLKECVLDYGPGSAFWLFACERLKGILGSVSTNRRGIEPQLMRKFITSQQVLGNDLEEVNQFSHSSYITKTKGSFRYDHLPEIPYLPVLSLDNLDYVSSIYCLVPPIKEGCLSSEEHRLIEKSLKQCFGATYVKTFLLCTYSKCIKFGGEFYGTYNSIHSTSSMVYAKKPAESQGHFQLTPGFVTKYIVVKVLLESKTFQVTLAGVNWLTNHEHKHWYAYGSPVEVWEVYDASNLTAECFIPVINILCRCAHIRKKVTFSSSVQETVTVIVPLDHFAGIH